MMILGIDASLNCTGWAIYDPLSGISWGVIEPSQSLSTDQKILYIVSQLRLGPIWHASHVFIEGEAYGAKGSSLVQLSELNGALKYAFNSGISRPIFSLPSSSARSMVLGTSKTPKKGTKAQNKAYCDWMIQKMNLGISNNDLKTDQLDALVIAKAGYMELEKIYPKLLLMRLVDHKIIAKSRKGTYTMGKGKKMISFKNFDKVPQGIKEVLISEYENKILKKVTGD